MNNILSDFVFDSIIKIQDAVRGLKEYKGISFKKHDDFGFVLEVNTGLKDVRYIDEAVKFYRQGSGSEHDKIGSINTIPQIDVYDPLNDNHVAIRYSWHNRFLEVKDANSGRHFRKTGRDVRRHLLQEDLEYIALFEAEVSRFNVPKYSSKSFGIDRT